MTIKYFEVNRKKLKVTAECFTDANEQVKDEGDKSGPEDSSEASASTIDGSFYLGY